MNRIWSLANFALTVVLVIVLVSRPSETVHARASHGAATDRLASGDPRSALTAADLRILFVDGDAAPRRLLLGFGTDMVDADRVGGEPAELGLRLEPDIPLLGTWIDPATLSLQSARRLALATLYTLHLGRAFASCDGRTVPKGLRIEFSTPAPRVTRVIVDGADASNEDAFLLGFDAAVDLPSLREKLEVKHHGDRVPVEVTDLGLADEHSYRVVVRKLVDPSGANPDRLPGEVAPAELGPGELAQRELALREFDRALDSVDVTVRAGVLPASGDVGTARDVAKRLVFRAPLRLESAIARPDRIELGFNRTMPLPSRDQIRIEPDQPYQVQRTSRGVRLVGAFRPGATLAVSLARGFPGSGRVVLARDLKRSLLVPDAQPEIRFTQTGTVLSAKARSELQIRAINVAELGVSVRRLYGNNVVQCLQNDGRSTDSMFAPGRTTVVPVGAQRNTSATLRVSLDKFLGSQVAGIYRVRIWDTAGRARARTRMVQVTDLGVTVRSTASAVAVQVVSLATGVAVASAEVQVVTPTDQGLVFGVTDERGIAVLRYQSTAKDRVPYLVHVRKDRDLAYVDLQGHAVELVDGTLSGRPYLVGGFEAYVKPSRGIMRPGETFESTVILRDRTGVAPSGVPVFAVLRAPGGREWWRTRAESSGAGLLSIRKEISTAAPSGRWNLQIVGAENDSVLGEAGFTVQAFVPNRLEAEVAVIDPLIVGKLASVRVRGRWLDGAPAMHRPVALRVRFDRDEFQADRFRGFSFRRETPKSPPGEQRVVRGILDANGETVLRVALPGKLDHQALVARLTAEVEDPSGRAVVESIRAPVRHAYHVGVRTSSTGGAELVAVDVGGDLAPVNPECRVTLEWRHFEFRMVRRARGWRYRTEVRSEEIETKRVSLLDGRASVAFSRSVDSTGGGWYVVVVRSGEQVCEQSITERPESPDRLRVQAPKEPVAPGSKTEIRIASPAAGRGFLTLEGNGIHAARVVSIARGDNTVGVEIPEGLDLPNVHAIVTLTRPMARKEDAGPFWLVGGAAIALRHASRGTTVDLSGPREVRPESRLDFAIRAPGATTATVALVDEGVLNLTRHPDPDPLAFFLARRRMDSRGADLGGFLMNRVRFQPGVQTGGDGGSGLSSAVLAGTINSRIRPVALFSEDVRLDREGKGVVHFDLPPYEGRLRLMVITAGPRVVGAASRQVVVKAPLSLQLATPRMLAPGDSVSLPLTVKNNTSASETVRLQVVAEHGLAITSPLPMADLVLGAGQVRTLDLAVRAGPAPVQRVRVVGVMGAPGIDAHRREVTAELAVRTPTVSAREELGLMLEGAQEIELPTGFTGERVTASFRVDLAPDVQLRGAVQSLLRYPHGCLEQTTSRCMGLLSCAALLPRMGIAKGTGLLHETGHVSGDGGSASARAMLQSGIDRIFSMQCGDGAFAWWPGGRAAYPYGTVHALDFVLAASTLGADVPAAAMRQALDALERIVAQESGTSLRCHAIEVLSRAGRPVQPFLDFLASAAVRRDDRARVALALSRNGQKRRARELMEHGEFSSVPSGRTVVRSSEPMLRSLVRDQALELRARLELFELDERTLALARRLNRVMARPARYTTQEKAQALRALAAYYAVLPAVVGADAEAPSVTISQGAKTWRAQGSERLELLVDPRRPLRLATRGRAFASLAIEGQRRIGRDLSSDRLELGFEVREVESGQIAESFRRGRTYEVTVQCTAPDGLENFLITHLLPGGFEPEPVRPHHTRRRVSRIACHVDRRDDRVLIFVPGRIEGQEQFRYRVRAVFPGRFEAPPMRLEAMYDPELVASTSPGKPVSIAER